MRMRNLLADRVTVVSVTHAGHPTPGSLSIQLGAGCRALSDRNIQSQDSFVHFWVSLQPVG